MEIPARYPRSSLRIVTTVAAQRELSLIASVSYTHLDVYKRQPVLHDRVKTESKTATVYISDVYRGRAMAGVPSGEARALRVFMSEDSPVSYTQLDVYKRQLQHQPGQRNADPP